MEITTSWQKLTTVGGAGAHLQKNGLGLVQLAYSTGVPTNPNVFVVRTYSKLTFSNTPTGQFIWAKTVEGTVDMSVEQESGVTSRMIISEASDFPDVLDGEYSILHQWCCTNGR